MTRASHALHGSSTLWATLIHQEDQGDLAAGSRWITRVLQISLRAAPGRPLSVAVVVQLIDRCLEKVLVRVTKSADRSDAIPTSEAEKTVKDTILSAVADGVVVVGTMRTLTRAWGVSTAMLRRGLRELLEADLISVQSGPHGQLTVRLGASGSRPLPALPLPVLPPARGGQRATPKLWIV